MGSNTINTTFQTTNVDRCGQPADFMTTFRQLGLCGTQMQAQMLPQQCLPQMPMQMPVLSAEQIQQFCAQIALLTQIQFMHLCSMLQEVPQMPPPQACPPPACIPPPTVQQSCAPTGLGLERNSDGSVTTAGGYKICAEGKDAAWAIYDPQGQLLTRVWGDPHVNEADGTRWDFTKSSNFVLPDGTRIFAKSSGEDGHPVTTQLDIANGYDRVKIDGIATCNPTTGAVTGGGYEEWCAEHEDTEDAFFLQHNDNKQDWVRIRDGNLDGVVNGTINKADGSYDQTVTDKLESERPCFGTAEWARMLTGILYGDELDVRQTAYENIDVQTQQADFERNAMAVQLLRSLIMAEAYYKGQLAGGIASRLSG